MIPTPVVVVVIAGLVGRLVMPLPWWRHIGMKLDEASGHVALWLRRIGLISW